MRRSLFFSSGGRFFAGGHCTAPISSDLPSPEHQETTLILSRRILRSQSGDFGIREITDLGDSPCLFIEVSSHSWVEQNDYGKRRCLG